MINIEAECLPKYKNIIVRYIYCNESIKCIYLDNILVVIILNRFVDDIKRLRYCHGKRYDIKVYGFFVRHF